jgi:tetratricopeptide (TPR) repeat protein
MGKIDHDAVLRARVLLLGSGRLSLLEQVHAYRVLAEVSPKAYLPKLVDALLSMSYRSRDPEVDLALGAEAVEAARRIAGAAARAERLCRALDVYQAALFALGRRAEGRAACEEMAEAGRGGRLANILAEEGRFREAAELNEKAARNGIAEHSFWNMVEWAANLEGAGLHDEALVVFGELLDETRREAAGQRTALAILTWELVHLSRMREAAGGGADAPATRREALTVLEELATTGEPKNWSCILAWWVTLFALSGRADEPAATAESPMPPFGTDLGWSSDTRDAFLGALPGLETEAARLRGAGRLPELVDVQRRISIRVTLSEGNHPYRFAERLKPYFDEGVALARRLPDDPARLARALTDRAMFLVAARTFEPAYADFAEAVALLDAR